MIILKSVQEIKLMRESGRITAEVCALLKEKIKPAITTLSLDEFAASLIRKKNAKPAFLGYHGYPNSICVSVNEEVVHGIPNRRVLLEGDVVSVDVGVLLNGFYGDMAFTVGVGEVSSSARKLIEVTEQCLQEGIEKSRPGHRLSDISHAIEKKAKENDFSVVQQYVGHGIGRQMHEDPQVPNFGPAGCGPTLKPGMTIAIEPMVNMGDYAVEVLPDGWTVVTKDRKLSAHFEHTIVITENGPEILTRL